MWGALCKLAAREQSRISECIKRHRSAVIAYPTREDPLGVDSRKRKYWAFQHDPSRLWVEATTGEGAGWEWRYYDTAALVTELLHALDESSSADEVRARRAQASAPSPPLR
eukprot:3028714-Prymnesium_polylepis.2